jgi:hypothetical protein
MSFEFFPELIRNASPNRERLRLRMAGHPDRVAARLSVRIAP